MVKDYIEGFSLKSHEFSQGEYLQQSVCMCLIACVSVFVGEGKHNNQFVF